MGRRNLPEALCPMLTIDRELSTVTIAGRRFPAVALICPPDGREPDTDLDRALAAGGGDQSVYIPAENGVLFRVQYGENESRRGLSLDVEARTCEKVWDYAGAWTWLPWSLNLVDGVIVAARTPGWYWAEPDWVIETIDRLASKPYVEPEGPLARLVRLNHFDVPQSDDKSVIEFE